MFKTSKQTKYAPLRIAIDELCPTIVGYNERARHAGFGHANMPVADMS